jgi:hypothetical protein
MEDVIFNSQSRPKGMAEVNLKVRPQRQQPDGRRSAS